MKQGKLILKPFFFLGRETDAVYKIKKEVLIASFAEPSLPGN